jgi:hypothetical protein
MIDIESAREQATQIEAGLGPGEVDQSAERIHETIALKVERIEYSGYRGAAQYLSHDAGTRRRTTDQGAPPC